MPSQKVSETEEVNPIDKKMRLNYDLRGSLSVLKIQKNKDYGES